MGVSRKNTPRIEPGSSPEVRLMLLRDLERSLAERSDEHVELLAEIHALIVETEARTRSAAASAGRAA